MKITYNGKTLGEIFDSAYRIAMHRGGNDYEEWMHLTKNERNAIEEGCKAVAITLNYGPLIPEHTLESIYDEAALSVDDGNPLLEHKRGLEAVATAVAHATVEMLEGKQ